MIDDINRTIKQTGDIQLQTRVGVQVVERARLDVNQDVDVAVWAIVAACARPEQGGMRHASRPKLRLARPQAGYDRVSIHIESLSQKQPGRRNRRSFCPCQGLDLPAPSYAITLRVRRRLIPPPRQDGDRYLRKLLVAGACATLRHRQGHSDALRLWASGGLSARRSRQVQADAVALANNVARIVFVLMTRGSQFDDRPVAARTSRFSPWCWRLTMSTSQGVHTAAHRLAPARASARA